MRWAVAVGLTFAVVVVTYVFMSGMFVTPHPPTWLVERPIAHRGDWADGPERPENSLAAFAEAAKRGFAVELDVQRTSDGAVVIVHDDELERVTGEPGLVSELALADVKERRLFGGDQRIATLDEALEVIDGRVPVFVEIKNDGEVGELEDAVAAALRDYDGDVAVMSFNPYSLARMAEEAPDIARGQLSGSFAGEDLAWYEVFVLRHLLMNWKSRPDFVAYERALLPSLETRLQRARGRKLLAWTAKTKAEREDAAALADGVISDPQALSDR